MALKKKENTGPANKITPAKPDAKETAPIAVKAPVVAEKKIDVAIKKEVKAAAPAETKIPVEQSATPVFGIQKDYLTTKNKCMVTFRLPSIAAPDAKSVCIVGEFNGWNMRKNPMKKQKSGDYSITLELERGKEYQYRYLIDQSKWENDWHADKYVKSPLGGCDNSVVLT